MHARTLWVVVFAAALPGCQVLRPDAFGSCNVQYASICEEYRASDELVAIKMAQCVDALGTWSEDPCPRSSPTPTGCCAYGSSVASSTMCFYDPTSAASDRAYCENDLGGR